MSRVANTCDKGHGCVFVCWDLLKRHDYDWFTFATRKAGTLAKQPAHCPEWAGIGKRIANLCLIDLLLVVTCLCPPCCCDCSCSCCCCCVVVGVAATVVCANADAAKLILVVRDILFAVAQGCCYCFSQSLLMPPSVADVTVAVHVVVVVSCCRHPCCCCYSCGRCWCLLMW